MSLLTKMIPLTLLALTANAIPLDLGGSGLQMRTLPPSNMSDWYWNVSDYIGGCSPAACTWSFNISAPVGPDAAPPFNAACTGNDLQNGGSFVPCDISDSESRVFAKLGQPTYGPPSGYNMSVIVSYAFERFMEETTVTFNYSGNGTGPYGPGSPGPQTFTFHPVNATAVA